MRTYRKLLEIIDNPVVTEKEEFTESEKKKIKEIHHFNKNIDPYDEKDDKIKKWCIEKDIEVRDNKLKELGI